MGSAIAITLIIGLLYCFWLFSKTMPPQQLGLFLSFVGGGLLLVSALSLIFTGHIPLVLGLLLGLWPLMVAVLVLGSPAGIQLEAEPEDPLRPPLRQLFMRRAQK